MSTVSAEWKELNNCFYFKQEVYDMCWKGVDISQHMVACGAFGGPIAVIRDQNKLLILGRAATAPRLVIYNAAGIQLASIAWDRPGGKLISMGWTDEELLLCVVESGQVYQYNLQGELLLDELNLGKECWEQEVSECVVWGSGLVCLTKANQLFAIPNLKEPEVVKFAIPPLAVAPTCMTIVDPLYTLSGQLEVLLAVGSSLLIVEKDDLHDQALSVGPVRQLAVSPNGTFVACFTVDGKLRVLSSDFSKTLSEFDTQASAKPDQLVWCGLDSVLAYWEDDGVLLMVGPSGNSVIFNYQETSVVLIPECDGVRILTNRTMELLQRVPDSTESIFCIGSTEPGALLYDAMEHFERRSAKADENIRMLGSDLPVAVEACILAAGHEFDVEQQKRLLRAAAYGHAFCRSFPKDTMRKMCQTLRILNSIRNYETAGIPLTYQQFQLLTGRVLVARLVNAHRHLLALRISQILELPEEPVLLHWASAKIAATSLAEDSELLELLRAKLKESKRISYASVAGSAWRLGRIRLAARLLEHETKAAEQVPLLVAMGEGERALAKALDSGDSHLCYAALFHLLDAKPLPDLMQLLAARPAARDLFVGYAREHDQELLKKFYAACNQPQGVAGMVLREAMEAAASNAPATVQSKLVEQAHELYAQAPDHGLHARACHEHAKLLKVQHELAAKTAEAPPVGASLADTLRSLLASGNHAAAQRLRVDMKVPDRTWYWLKAASLANARDWEGLEKFSKERRPPVGFRPFVEVCLEKESFVEAAKYIPKLTDLQERAEAYARAGMMAEAAGAAAQAKDGELLARVRSTFTTQNSAASALLDSIRDRLAMSNLGPS